MQKYILIGGLIAGASALHAEPTKPGLWENTATVNFTQGGPQIPPEQLEKMRQMGIDLPFGKPHVIKTCVTPEMAARNDPPRVTREQDGCKMSRIDPAANPITGELVCEGDIKGKGSLKVFHDSPSSFKGSLEFTGVDKRGTPLAMQTSFSGRWLSDDCGDVRPPALPK
jgi:hypothetical protein